MAAGLSIRTGVNFWTSGFKDKVCNNWCTNKDENETISQSTNWLQKTPTNPLVDNCVTIEFNDGDASKSGLKFADCSSKTEFICEVTK
jgi:Lectin C-type domain